MPTKRKENRLTIRHVAEHAGVSIATVSKVLRDADGVSDNFRERVRESVRHLGYRPHAAARGMRGHTYTLGILLPELKNPFFGDLMVGLNSALERTQYQPLLGISQVSEPIELTLIDAMLDRQMDGIVLVGPRIPPEDIVKVAARVPTAVIGLHVPTATTFDTINNDDENGGALVVRHLVENGYRNIAMVSLAARPPQLVVTQSREAGYRRAMDEAGLSAFTHVISAQHTSRDAQTILRHLLETPDRPEALFCWTDYVAKLALSVARDLGLSVPNDLAIVGYDNTADCELSQNSLTSVDQSAEVLGLQAARLLIERINGRERVEHFVVTPRLVARDSSRRRLG